MECVPCATNEVNTHEARRFLAMLGSGPFTFQTFDDDSARKDRALARTLHGSLSELEPRLEALNRRGAGVFITVNEVRQGAPRTSDNIVRVVALFVDLDGAPIQPVLDWKIRPHIVVESSRGKFHAYWCVDDVSLDDFSDLQRKLAAQFNGDPVVHDLPRVMRLPGFWHQKVDKNGVRSEPFQTIIREDLLNAW